MTGLLNLPPEIRLIIFNFSLHLARSSRHNEQLRLLQTCAQIATEAGPILRQYLCLKDESQIRGLLFDAHKDHLAQVCTAEVASDSRLFRDNETSELVPVSALYIALRKMTSLRTLRVSEVERAVFVDQHALAGKRLITDFERALFPLDTADQPPLSSYELLLPGKTTVALFITLRSPFIESLRLSGTVRFANTPSTTLKNLKHLTIDNVHGSYFDTRDFSQDFPSVSTLESFIHSQTGRLGFELRDHHLHTISTAVNSLRKLVLIDCRELATATIAHCLNQFQRLEYFALALVTTVELEVNFIRDVLPPTIQVLRLAIRHGRWTRAFVDKESDIYRSVGDLMQEAGGVLAEVSLDMRPKFSEDPSWMVLLYNAAHHSRTRLILGPWTNSERI